MLTLDGKPLALPDPHGKLSAFLERYLPTAHGDLFAPPAALTSQRNATRYDNRVAVGLPVPNWPDMPPLRINTLYWPSGASRFSYGVFLADDATANAIYQDAAGSDGLQTVNLVMNDEAGGSVNVPMFLLPAKELAATLGGTSDLWLMPLVDERYWLQFKDTAENLQDFDGTFSWSDVFDALQITGDGDNVPSGYKIPDPTEISRQYDNFGLLADAIALSVGLRIVPKHGGGLLAQSSNTAQQNLQENFDQLADRIIAGGKNFSDDGDMPEQLQLVCRRYTDHHALTGGDDLFYIVNHNLGSGATKQDTTVTVHTTAFADFTTGSGTPANSSALISLAAAIASDYQAWLGFRFHATFQGINAWTMSGAEHYVAWSFGRQCNGAYECQTEVVSLPSNFFAEQQLSQDKTLLPILSDFVVVKLAADLKYRDKADANVEKFNTGATLGTDGVWEDDTDPDGSPFIIRVYDSSLAASIDKVDSGAFGDANWESISNKWVFEKTGGGDGTAILKVTDFSGVDGQIIQPDTDGVFQGVIEAVDLTADLFSNDAPYTDGDECRILVMRGSGDNSHVNPRLIKGMRLIGKYAGKITEDVDYPTFVVEKIYDDAIFFLNDTGDTIPAYGVMALTEVEEATFASSGFVLPSYVAAIQKPSTTFFRNYLVNDGNSVADGAYGYAQNGEYVYVLYNSGSPANNDGYGPVPGQWYVDKGYPETATVVGTTTDTDAFVMLVRWKQITELLVSTNTMIAKGSTGDVTVLITVGGMATPLIGMTLDSVASPFADVDSDKLCEVTWVNGYPTLTAKEC